MPFLHRKPDKPLSQYVELLWLSENYSVPHKRERLLPEGTVELVINLNEDHIRIYDSNDYEQFRTIPGCVVSGPRSTSFVVDTDTQSATIGAHFKAGGSLPFFGIPTSELTNNSVPLECLWGRSAGSLRERLLAAYTSENRLRVLEECLLEQLAPVVVHPVVGFALQQLVTGRPLAISRLVERVGFSQRHFTQLFSDGVGLAPKLFSRVSRFQKVVQTLHARRQVNWTDIALSCGYYDQAHFNHDFQSFAGMTPTEYQAKRTEHVNHVPLVV